MLSILDASEQIRPQIVIADSYKTRALVLYNFLKELSIHLEVLHVPDGRTALSAANEHSIPLFIIDAFLAGSIGGFDLCRAIRRADRDRQTSIILMLSGHLIPEHGRAMSAGADLLLHSPVVKEELWKMVVLLSESPYTKQNADPILAVRDKPPRTATDRAQIKRGNRKVPTEPEHTTIAGEASTRNDLPFKVYPGS